MAQTIHFGKLLRGLRLARGLTQTQLAELAGVTNTTIARAENTPACKWYTSTAKAVLDALENLHSGAPLTPRERSDYLAATGMPALTRAPSGPSAIAQSGLSLPDRLEEADRKTCHLWLTTLIEEKGAANVMRWLDGLAAGNDIDLPPRLHASDIPVPTATLVTDEIVKDPGEGKPVPVRIRTYKPVKPKRRSA